MRAVERRREREGRATGKEGNRSPMLLRIVAGMLGYALQMQRIVLFLSAYC